jgi:hypothetical protein
MSDFTLSYHGSVVLLRPNTEAARTWASFSLPEELPMFGSSIAVNPRYVEEICHGILDDGLTVEA